MLFIMDVVKMIRCLWDVYDKDKKNSQIIGRVDKPLIDLLPEKLKKNSWFDTAHAMNDCKRF